MLSLLIAAAAASAAPLREAERVFLEFRDADDRARVSPSPHRSHVRDLRAAQARAGLAAIDDARLGDDDRRALEAMRRALAPVPAVADDLARRTYDAFRKAAEAIPFDGEVLDRLTIGARLATEPDPARRKLLFYALAPVWASVAGRPGTQSPYAELVKQRIEAWGRDPRGSPLEAEARAWGLEPAQLESWFVKILEAWRDHAVGPATIEPWDWAYVNGAADRALDAALPKNRMVDVARRYYRDLGVDPSDLGIELDLAPRRGKDPVAFTDFVRRGREVRGRWKRGQFVVSASYRTGGLGLLYELMHEMGHAAHLAAIRARPAENDWPDSDVLTESVADMLGVTAYDEGFQRRYVGTAADPSDSARACLSSYVMDVAWALLEIRAHREPFADPNALWTEIASRYLGIAPHPEIAWWATRGQLVGAPGYMTNYAMGAVLTEALRARVAEVRGRDAFEAPSSALYSWLSDQLFRFGQARASRTLVEEFLGAPPDPAPLVGRISSVGPPR